MHFNRGSNSVPALQYFWDYIFCFGIFLPTKNTGELHGKYV